MVLSEAAGRGKKGKKRKGTSGAGRRKSGRKVWNRAADWLRPALLMLTLTAVITYPKADTYLRSLTEGRRLSRRGWFLRNETTAAVSSVRAVP